MFSILKGVVKMEKAMHITVYRSEHRQDPQYDMTIFGCGPTTCRIVVEPKWEGTNKQVIKLVDLLEILPHHRKPMGWCEERIRNVNEVSAGG